MCNVFLPLHNYGLEKDSDHAELHEPGRWQHDTNHMESCLLHSTAARYTFQGMDLSVPVYGLEYLEAEE